MPKSRSRSKSPKKSRSRSRSRSPMKSPGKIYCLKCRMKTDSVNAKKVKTSRGRQRISCKCKKCGTKKSLFVKS